METKSTGVMGNEANELIENVERLAGDVRLHIHLAGMELKDEWNKLEPHVLDAKRHLVDATDTSVHALQQLLSSVKKVHTSLPPHA